MPVLLLGGDSCAHRDRLLLGTLNVPMWVWTVFTLVSMLCVTWSYSQDAVPGVPRETA